MGTPALEDPHPFQLWDGEAASTAPANTCEAATSTVDGEPVSTAPANTSEAATSTVGW